MKGGGDGMDSPKIRPRSSSRNAAHPPSSLWRSLFKRPVRLWTSGAPSWADGDRKGRVQGHFWRQIFAWIPVILEFSMLLFGSSRCILLHVQETCSSSSMLQLEFNAVQVGLELGPIFGPIRQRQLERELGFRFGLGGFIICGALLIGTYGYRN